ncbi:hypothetical protein MMC06_002565 [Schaereria dolodes]|nr:hypothetical protein [Schaereria dolodes]
MSLARKFTRRYQASTGATMPLRATSVRKHDGSIDRCQISLPVELLSSTNVLAYDAPDIHRSTSSSTTNSYSDSDSSPVFSSSSRDTTPDTSVESSPTSTEPNHLSCYFRSASNTTNLNRHSNSSSHADIPAIPTRALSHTKKSHQDIARKRSISTKSPPPSILPSNASMRGSIEIFSSKSDANHPFGAELEQVNELAEEFLAKEVTVWDEEEQYLSANGFYKYGAEDYVMEIEPLFGGAFDDVPFPMAAGWI